MRSPHGFLFVLVIGAAAATGDLELQKEKDKKLFWACYNDQEDDLHDLIADGAQPNGYKHKVSSENDNG